MFSPPVASYGRHFCLLDNSWIRNPLLVEGRSDLLRHGFHVEFE
jgi:hypothetical protein